MTPSFYRELRKNFIETETRATKAKAERSSLGYFNVGELVVDTPEQQYKFDICVTDDSDKISHAAIILTMEDEYIIVFNREHLKSSLMSVDNNVLTIIAHEIGHFLSGHLTGDSDNKKVINYNKEDQIFLMNEYYRLETDEAHDAYMNCLLYGLLKGGCQTLELEADIVALKFVHVVELIATHMATLDEMNFYTKIEKMNRIKQLRNYANQHDIDKTGYGLKLTIFQNDGSSIDFSCGTF